PGAVSRFNATTGAFVDSFVVPGSGGLVDPEGIVFGPDGNLYVTNGDSVNRYNGTTGAFIDAFVSAGSGGLTNTRGIVFGRDGNLLVGNFNFGGGGFYATTEQPVRSSTRSAQRAAAAWFRQGYLY